MREDRSGIIFLIIFFLVVGFMVYWIYFGVQDTPINQDYSWQDLSIEENCEVIELSSFDGKNSILKIKDNSSSGLSRLIISFSPKIITKVSLYIQFESIQTMSLIFGTYRVVVDTFTNFDKYFSASKWQLVDIYINGTGNQTIISIYVDNQFESRSTTIDVYTGEYVNKIEFITSTIQKNNIYIDIISVKEIK